MRAVRRITVTHAAAPALAVSPTIGRQISHQRQLLRALGHGCFARHGNGRRRRHPSAHGNYSSCDRNGGGWGDPHITTVDGVHYDFQSAGEFTALREDDSKSRPARARARRRPFRAPNRLHRAGGCASRSTPPLRRASARTACTLQPNLQGEPDPSGLQLRVNGSWSH